MVAFVFREFRHIGEMRCLHFVIGVAGMNVLVPAPPVHLKPASLRPCALWLWWMLVYER
jgi:hypothetical protein